MAYMAFQFRRDTAANWASANPVLAEGEIGVDLTVGLMKIGDGASAWSDLDFFGEGVTDHGALSGLSDDDHTQYHNDARGDVRYAPIAKGVTNGDSHDHNGGGGAQISYASLSGTPDLSLYTQKAADETITGTWTYEQPVRLRDGTLMSWDGAVWKTCLNLDANPSRVAVGVEAPRDSTGSVSDTTAIGYAAGAALTSGLRNLMLGTAAGGDTTSVNYLSALGYQAGRYVTSADVVAIGYVAAGLSLGGSRLVAIGSNAGYGGSSSDATAPDSVLIGGYAMNRYSASSTNNVAIGYYALGQLITRRLYTNNVAIGYQSGYGASGTTGNCIYIGYRAGYQPGTLSNRLGIGYDFSTNAHIIEGNLPNTDLRFNATTLNLAYNNKAGTPQVTAVNLANAVVGSTIGVFGVAAAARVAAYTQTYATATRTHDNLTSATLIDSTGGTASTTVAAVSGTGDDADINNNFADLVAQINALRVDLVNAKGVINQIIDDQQTYGWFQ